MHNPDNKHLTRPGFEPSTSEFRPTTRPNEPPGPSNVFKTFDWFFYEIYSFRSLILVSIPSLDTFSMYIHPPRTSTHFCSLSQFSTRGGQNFFWFYEVAYQSMIRVAEKDNGSGQGVLTSPSGWPRKKSWDISLDGHIWDLTSNNQL